LAIVQPEAAGEAPSGPVSWYGVASPAALSGFAGTTISQSEFADSGGAVAAADGHGVVLADAAGAGATLGLVGDAAGVGAALELVADAAGAGVAVEAMPEAVEVGTAGPVVAGVAGELLATPVGAGVADADGVPLSAVAMGATAATSDMAGLADPAAADAADAAQAPGRPAALLEALSTALMCGALRVAIPAASATVRSPIIGARRARGCCGWPR
jgi:hypothetical protein